MKMKRETILTPRLLLRPLAMTDLADVQSWAGNPANTRYMAWGPNSEDDTRGFLSSAAPGKDFGVVLRDTGSLIGSCGIYPDDRGDSAEVGWILHMDHWKHGYGTELGGALIAYGFGDLGLRRITAPCAAANYGSWRVMQRNGMRLEATRRKAFWARVDREWIDGLEYAILAEDHFASLAKGQDESPQKLQDLSFANDAFAFSYRVGAIAIFDGKVLAIEQNGNGNDSGKNATWQVPVGNVSSLEPAKAALARVLLEAAGIHECRIGDLALVCENISDEGGIKYREATLFFLVEIADVADIQSPTPGGRAEWVAVGGLKEGSLFPKAVFDLLLDPFRDPDLGMATIRCEGIGFGE